MVGDTTSRTIQHFLDCTRSGIGATSLVLRKAGGTDSNFTPREPKDLSGMSPMTMALSIITALTAGSILAEYL